MIQFDPSQQRVLAFEPTAHARVLGAAGSGKTALLAEAYAAALDRPGWVETDVLALAASRAAAASLRNAVETRLARPIGGTPVRTPAMPTMFISRKTTIEPMPMAMTKFTKLPQSRNRLAARK